MRNRQSRAKIAEETLQILECGHYVSPAETCVRIDEALAFARDNSVLYAPEMFSEVFAQRDALVRSMVRVRTVFEVVNGTTLSAARERVGEDAADYACLNFASAKNPGGGFLGGSQAQEESLARSSGLYPCIHQMSRMYETNRRCGTCLYTDHMIYSPRVPVIRDDESELLEQSYRISILTVPAVNAGAVHSNEPHNIDKIAPTMIGRIEKLLSVAVIHGHSRLILGAWGCGVFKNDPAQVAGWFYEQFTGNPALAGVFDRVVFAITDRSEERRFIGPFERRFNGWANEPSSSTAGRMRGVAVNRRREW